MADHRRLERIGSSSNPRATWRLKRLVQQLLPAESASAPLPAHAQLLLDQHQVLQDLRVDLDLPLPKLRQLTAALVREMYEGLDPKTAAGANLKMLPSYVEKKELAAKSGTFLAVDLGGSNLRVMRVTLKQGRVQPLVPEHVLRAVIPKELQTGDGEALFDFIAGCIARYVREQGLAETKQALPLGFTFSFPVQLLALDAGTLTTWTKGFTAEGVVGKDVVGMLRAALGRQPGGLADKIRVQALCNDTVGTLVARYFEDQRAEIGLILGTGSNACYWERNIPKLAGRGASSPPMCVNMEWGAFDSGPEGPKYLPVTRADRELDAASNNVGKQRFEKMISGMYLWELVRIILNDLARRGLFYQGSPQELFKGPWLSGGDFRPILQDSSKQLTPTGRVLRECLVKQGVARPQHEFSLTDRETARQVCRLVVQRAARLAACGVYAILVKAGSPKGSVVAVDGGVYQHTPGFAKMMEEALQELDPKMGAVLQLQQDGSGVGAALIAAWSSPEQQ